jgi:hypothetical protein
MSRFEAFGLGVVGGAVAGFVVLFMIRVFDVVLLPWYRQLLYHGIDLSGTWENRVKLPAGLTQTLNATLGQKADQVVGTVTVAKSKPSGEMESLEGFAMEGRLFDRLFVGTMRPTDRRRLGVATMLLEVVGDGHKMIGWTTWYDSTHVRVAERIGGMGVEWLRSAPPRQ